jgi:periplasmic copper chaperone A
LFSASSPIAQNAEFRVFDVKNGVYGMHEARDIELSPGAPDTVLRPGGAQLVLEGLQKSLQVGKTFPLSLTFEEAGNVRVEVQTENPRMIMGESILTNSFSSAALHGGLQ